MNIKEFGENSTVVYDLTIYVNGRTAVVTSANSETELQDKLQKVQSAIKDELYRQYEALPEPTEGV